MGRDWQFKVEVYSQHDCSPEDPCVLFHSSGELLVTSEDGEILHGQGYKELLNAAPQDAAFLGTWNGQRCYAIALPDNINLQGFVKLSIREVIAFHEAELGCLVCMGKQLLDWRQQTKFCSYCAQPLQEKVGERARYCPACESLYYPRINPAVITAVRKNGKLLMAHNRNFSDGVYSLVAGYVEVGESLEQAAKREVQEEVGINIKNIRYWGSQAWPFSSSLMVGFVAEYESGEIKPDGQEIDKAGWYDLEQLPPLPRQGSIARRIIESIVVSG